MGKGKKDNYKYIFKKYIGFNISIKKKYPIRSRFPKCRIQPKKRYKISIWKTTNHSLALIKQIPQSINYKSSNNYSNKIIYSKTKIDYERALTDSGFSAILTYTTHTTKSEQKKETSYSLIYYATVTLKQTQEKYSLNLCPNTPIRHSPQNIQQKYIKNKQHLHPKP